MVRRPTGTWPFRSSAQAETRAASTPATFSSPAYSSRGLSADRERNESDSDFGHATSTQSLLSRGRRGREGWQQRPVAATRRGNHRPTFTLSSTTNTSRAPTSGPPTGPRTTQSSLSSPTPETRSSRASLPPLALPRNEGSTNLRHVREAARIARELETTEIPPDLTSSFFSATTNGSLSTMSRSQVYRLPHEEGM